MSQVTCDRMGARCLAWLEARDARELPALLYSGGPRGASARFHLLARRPRVVVTGSLGSGGNGADARFRALEPSGAVLDEAEPGELLALLRRLETDLPRPPSEGSPSFRGGWIGAFGYDLAWIFEYGLPRHIPPVSALPDLWLAYYDSPLVLDREERIVRPANYPRSMPGQMIF